MSYRKLKTLDYLVTVVLTLITVIVVLGVATCKHASAQDFSTKLPSDRQLCFGFVRDPGAAGVDKLNQFGVIGPACYFVKNSSVGHEILKECPWESYCRIESERTKGDEIGSTKDMHPIVTVFVIKQWDRPKKDQK